MMRHCLAYLLAFLPLTTATAQIEGPATSEPGDLIVLSAVGEFESCAWTLANSDKTYLPVENNRKVVFASGTPGKYAFILATSVVVSESAIETRIFQHVVTINGDVPAPGPQPNPGPDPPKPVPPQPDLTGLARDALAAVQTADTQPAEVRQTVANLRATASKAAGLSSMDVPAINADLVARNRQAPFTTDDIKARWSPFFQWFGSAMQDQQDRDAAIEALNDIADGLEASLPRTQAAAVGNTAADALRQLQQARQRAESLMQAIDSEVGQ